MSLDFRGWRDGEGEGANAGGGEIELRGEMIGVVEVVIPGLLLNLGRGGVAECEGEGEGGGMSARPLIMEIFCTEESL